MGFFSSVPGSIEQKQCLPGTYQNSSGSSFCIDSSPGEFVYPFVTATLFSAYYGPNEEGSYVTGSAAGGASSLPQIGNYDKLGNILTANHYFNFVTAKGNTADDIFEFTSTAPLNAAFSPSKTSGVFPLDVNFVDRSTGNVSSWSWDFGDGSTSSDQNPSHTYNDSGRYTVSLTVSDGTNNSVTTKNNLIDKYKLSKV